MLTVKNLCWSIDNKTILSNINLSTLKQSVTAIVGPNGSGKTSLLRCIYRQNQIQNGAIELNGININQFSNQAYAKQVAVVTQNTNEIFALTVSDIVAIGLLPYLDGFKTPSALMQSQLNTIFDSLEITTFKHKKFNTLSGGEQQRVLIARALAQQPSLLILDEPTNHLDIHYQHQILTLIKSLKLTVLMTVHDLNLAAKYCDQIIMLNQGEVVAAGTPENVLTKSTINKVFDVEAEIGVNPLSQSLQVFYDA